MIIRYSGEGEDDGGRKRIAMKMWKHEIEGGGKSIGEIRG